VLQTDTGHFLVLVGAKKSRVYGHFSFIHIEGTTMSCGDQVLRTITLTNNQTGQQETIDPRWLFLCLGGVPHTEWAAAAGVARASDGYLVTGPDLQLNGAHMKSWPLERAPFYLESNVPGLFAAGDVRHGSVKRCASAVCEGAMAVTFAHSYLSHP
jgi:thioredoxin reductase (NADPH)